MMQFIMCGCLPKSSISWGLVALQTSTEVAQGTEQRALRHSIYPKSRLGISQKDRKPWCSPRSISKLKKKCNIWSVGAQTGNQLIWREKHWVTVPSMLGTIKNKMSKSLLKAHLVDLVSALHSYLAGICITQPFTPRLIFGGWSEHFYEQFFWHLSVHNEPPLNFLMYIQTKIVIQIQLVCLWSGSESAVCFVPLKHAANQLRDDGVPGDATPMCVMVGPGFRDGWLLSTFSCPAVPANSRVGFAEGWRTHWLNFKEPNNSASAMVNSIPTTRIIVGLQQSLPS